jgi:hypothetical protein
MRRERPARPSCSQNAHDKNVLVRCAQLKGELAVPLFVANVLEEMKQKDETAEGFS